MIRQSVRFGDKITRAFNIRERDRTQNRFPLLLIALSRELESKPAFYPLLSSTLGDAYRFNEFQRARSCRKLHQ